MKQLSKLALIFLFLLFNLHSEDTEDMGLESRLVIIAVQGAAQRVGPGVLTSSRASPRLPVSYVGVGVTCVTLY